MAKESASRTIRLKKTENFSVLYGNPGGARYYQNGRFFTCGGKYLPIKLGGNQLPPAVRLQIDKDGGLKPIEEVQEEKVQVEDAKFACPHCDKTYKDEDWYKKHLATHEIEE